MLYGDQGCVPIDCGNSAQVPLPSGQWKLLSYTIDQTDSYRAVLAKEREARRKARKPGDELTTEELHEGLLESFVGVEEARRLYAEQGPRATTITADATGDCPTVKVARGQAVELPFGPPFKPVVTGHRTAAEEFVMGPEGILQAKPALGKEKVYRLSLQLVGAAGEVCTGLTIDGETPPAPKFSIKTRDGKVIQSGDFEYG